MMPGLSSNLQLISDSRKTAIIDSELERLNVDIAVLQETRLAGFGSLQEKNYTIFWRGKGEDERRIHGVGFAVKTSLLPMIQPPTGGTERLLSVRVNTRTGPVNIIACYAPTLDSNPDEKDAFYEELDALIGQIPQTDDLYLLGDFNARVGSSHEDWPSCIGHHGVGKLNENGQRLLELCGNRQLCITNTYFQNKARHKVSWMHPRSHHWHQLDLVITKRDNLQKVYNTRSYHSADCDTDHAIVISKVVLYPRKIHHAKPKGLPKINTANTKDTERIDSFLSSIRTLPGADISRSAEDRWTFLREKIHTHAIEAFGKKIKTNKDWFEANLQTLKPLIETKRRALLT